MQYRRPCRRIAGKAGKVQEGQLQESQSGQSQDGQGNLSPGDKAQENQPQKDTRGTIRMGVLQIADSFPLYVAAQEGLFEKHGLDVEIIEFQSASDQSVAYEAGELDGMMTDITGQALMTFYADCVPLLLVDPVHKAIANVHSGWRGTIKGIGSKAVRMMREVYGSDPSKLVAAIGPSICWDCFEVSEDVAQAFMDRYDASLHKDLVKTGRLTESGEQKYHVNLQRACMENFLEAGLKKQNISLPDLCTACNKDYLFSHRASFGKRGNQAAVLMLR